MHHVEQEICSDIHQKHANSLQTHHAHPLQSSIVETVGCSIENKGTIEKNPSLLLCCASRRDRCVLLSAPEALTALRTSCIAAYSTDGVSV